MVVPAMCSARFRLDYGFDNITFYDFKTRKSWHAEGHGEDLRKSFNKVLSAAAAIIRTERK
jgi:hypothetical protein